MRIIEIKAFQFEELDSQTKEKVIEDNLSCLSGKFAGGQVKIKMQK